MDPKVDKFLASQKVDRALAPSAGPEVEYFVSGAAVEMEPGQVPCLLQSDNGETATVVLSDGQFTGTTFIVPSASVTAAEAAYLEQGARDLFPGVKHVE